MWKNRFGDYARPLLTSFSSKKETEEFTQTGRLKILVFYKVLFLAVLVFEQYINDFIEASGRFHNVVKFADDAVLRHEKAKTIEKVAMKKMDGNSTIYGTKTC